jgi:hypothetical protein
MLNRMDVTKWTVVAATGELVVVGLILLVRPQLFAWLVYGAEFSDTGKALGWLTGIALLVLALATWPTLPRQATRHHPFVRHWPTTC